MKLQGLITAPITPFANGGRSIDLAALERLVERQIDAGVAALMPCGTTGENAALSPTERTRVIECVSKTSAGRVPVIAGTGTAATPSTVELSQQAVDAGADAVMVIMPYYTMPTQDGLLEHVKAVGDAIEQPIVLYNNPMRSVVPLHAETVERMCEATPQVVAVKDSTGSVAFCQEVLRRLGERITVVCGDDDMVVPMFAMGAKAHASVLSNIIPARMVALVREAAAGGPAKARQLQCEVLGLCRAVFSEPFPASTKAAVAMLGLAEPIVRGPLLGVSGSLRERLAEELATLGCTAEAR